MRWYNHLYLGEKAAGKRFRLIQSIRIHKPLHGAYVITPAINGNNILDIYEAAELLKPYYKDRDLLIVGVAADYWEALLVARQIVDDLYSQTGDFKLEALLNKK